LTKSILSIGHNFQTNDWKDYEFSHNIYKSKIEM